MNVTRSCQNELEELKRWFQDRESGFQWGGPGVHFYRSLGFVKTNYPDKHDINEGIDFMIYQAPVWCASE